MTIGPSYHTHFYVCTFTQSRCVGCGHTQGEPEPFWQRQNTTPMMYFACFEDPEPSETPIFDRLKDEMGLIWPENDLN